MKSVFNNYGNLIVFILALLMLGFSGKVSSQDKKKEKKIMIVTADAEKGKGDIEKKIEIKANEDGTLNYKEWVNGELVKDEKITEDELKDMQAGEEDGVRVFCSPDSNKKMIWIEKEEDQIVDVEELLDKMEDILIDLNEDIDVDKVMVEMNEKLHELNIELKEKIDLSDVDGLLEDLHKQNNHFVYKFKDIDGDTSMTIGDEEIVIMKKIPDDTDVIEDKEIRKVHKIIIIKKECKIEDFDETSPVTVQNDLKLSDLKFFPNPNDGNFTVEFSNPKGKPVSIVVYDLNGKVLFKEDIIGEKNISRKLDVNIPEKGTYILRIEQNNKALSKKLIIF